MREPLIILFFLPILLVVINFIYYLSADRHFIPDFLKKFAEVFFLVFFPTVYLLVIDAPKNNCCGDTAVFSPDHKLTIYAIIVLTWVSYYMAGRPNRDRGPLAIAIAHCFLMIGILFNFVLYPHFDEPEMWLLFNLPIVILLTQRLIESHRLLLKTFAGEDEQQYRTWKKAILSLLRTPVFVRFPLLFLLCFPLLFVLIIILLVFGQEPDSVVRAFTDTYHQGLSQLDYMCNDVVCDDHYLCTVAANGHKGVVKPVRKGLRGGRLIICNRQLLVANAFEDLIQQKAPQLHRIIRHNYDKVGDFVQRYYGVFRHKWVADVVYIIMKPLEWLFVAVLYLADKNPENRIAIQYIDKTEQGKLRKELNIK